MTADNELTEIVEVYSPKKRRGRDEARGIGELSAQGGDT